MTSDRASNKLIIVSQHYAPDATTTATYLTAIANGFKNICHTLVLSGTSKSGTAKETQPLVVEVGNWAPAKNALVRRSIAMILFSLKMFVATLRHARRGDVVLCVTTPFTLPYPVALAAKMRGARSVLLIYDLYPEALVMSGLAQPRSITARIIRFANGLLFPSLDAIITIGRDVENLLLSYKGVMRDRIKLIPNWVLLPIGYRAINANSPYRRSLDGKFIVGLSGNLGFTHSPETVYEAAQLLRDDENVHFILSGWGSGWQQLRELHAKEHLDNVTLVERVPEAELEEFLAAADIWIIPYRRNVAGVSVPSRIYNLLAIGRPVIVTAEHFSEAAQILEEDDIGWVTKPEDPGELADAIRSAASNPDDSRAKGQRATDVAAKYTHDDAIASYRKVIDDIAHTPR